MKNPGNQCGKKMRFRTERFARKVAARAAATRGVELQPYVCRECAGWHLSRSDDVQDARASAAKPRPAHPVLAKLAQVHTLMDAGVLRNAETRFIADVWTCTQKGTDEKSIAAHSEQQIKWLNDIWERHFA